MQKGDAMKKIKRTLSDYIDIIDLPRHVSSKRTQMTIANRAAQFAPFAAVVGHEAAICETARLTEKRKELDETEKAVVDDKLRQIESWLPEKREVKILYFEPDKTKVGGKYITKVGIVKKIDVYNLEVVFNDGNKISIEEIYSIEFK